MLSQEHVCVKVGDPLLALLRDPEVAQGINDKRLNHLPEKIRIFCPQVSGTFVCQLIADSCLAKFIE